MARKLGAKDLRWTCADREAIDRGLREGRSDVGERSHDAIGQERALEALETGLEIGERGFNIFVSGPPGTGRTSTVRRLLWERARRAPTPDDVILLYNFEDRERPLAVRVPAGAGPTVEDVYLGLILNVLVRLEAALASDAYAARAHEIDERVGRDVDAALKPVAKEARRGAFALTKAGSAFTLVPADAKGKPLTEEAFEALPEARREALAAAGERLRPRLEEAVRRAVAIEARAEERKERLARETAQAIAGPLFDAAKKELRGLTRVTAHLDALREDLLDELGRLFPRESAGAKSPSAAFAAKVRRGEAALDEDESPVVRYRVNVLVTRAPGSGAPVVHEMHPTTANLIGRIEQREQQNPPTDFMRIRAGDLFRANGGYLILEAQEIARDSAAWDALKRALRNRAIELEDPGEPGRIVAPPSLRPECVPLDVKVCLIGTPDSYRAFSTDPDFAKLFKMKAEFEVDVDRTKERVRAYAGFLARTAAKEGLAPLAPGGAARIIEHASRIADRGSKLTTRFGDIADLLREASYRARRLGRARIERAHVRAALDARREREGLLERHIREDALSGRIRIETEGAVVGQLNGLTVSETGGYSFGSPARITCSVGAGRGEVVDVERETDLGGPIYGKATLILRGILVDRFAARVPLSIEATLCLEQTYAEIEGDSASLAEACALFSALSGAPLSQAIAVTGSIDQRGRVQAVGGVNEKVEGFERLCREGARGARRGVIIPASTAPDLMLDEDVVAAAREGALAIHAVDTLEEALRILTGRPYAALQEAILATLARLHAVRLEAQRSDGPKR